ncbi:MAG: enoyl-CoA hydratase/isomerase family protein [Phycisphaerales bacterium]|nr:enoyl-CoA hydratase/isomerase family protein [Phycisphaerales bacterium]
MSAPTLPVHRDTDGPTAAVVTLTLSQPDRPVVVLDRALLSAIDAALDTIARDHAASMRGFVLASASRVFVAGADLKEIMAQGDAELHEYLRFGARVFGRIAALPVTTVAAINGAALGGGLELAMHCDHLIAARPAPGGKTYQVGLPEAGLCICPGWGGTNLLPARMDPARAIELTATGKTMPVEEARECGLIEDLTDPAELMARAKTLALRSKAGSRTEPRCLASADPAHRPSPAVIAAVRAKLPPTGAARAVVACVEEGLARGWQACLEMERRELVRLRSSDEGQKAIGAFFARSAAKP